MTPRSPAPPSSRPRAARTPRTSSTSMWSGRRGATSCRPSSSRAASEPSSIIRCRCTCSPPTRAGSAAAKSSRRASAPRARSCRSRSIPSSSPRRWTPSPAPSGSSANDAEVGGPQAGTAHRPRGLPRGAAGACAPSHVGRRVPQPARGPRLGRGLRRPRVGGDGPPGGGIAPRAAHDRALLGVLGALVCRERGRVRVLDFGGGLGLDYLHLVASLGAACAVDYHIVETPEICREAGGLYPGDAAVRFHTALPADLAEVDVATINTALQYVDDWAALLRALCAYRPRYVLLV